MNYTIESGKDGWLFDPEQETWIGPAEKQKPLRVCPEGAVSTKKIEVLKIKMHGRTVCGIRE